MNLGLDKGDARWGEYYVANAKIGGKGFVDLVAYGEI